MSAGGGDAAKVIHADARCRNCGKPATDRKRQVCSPGCRLALRRRRAEWEAQRLTGELQIAKLTHIDVIRSVGAQETVEQHALSDPLTPFDRWALEQIRAEIAAVVGPRPGKR